ncbi:MAG: ABC transporter substrate-binding protein [Solobacterium sp.]|nr:ABC transporter substrate-binding protein [Solobacterium sp.]
MKTIKRLMTLLLAASLVGCGSSSASGTDSGASASGSTSNSSTSDVSAATGQVADETRTAAEEPVDKVVVAVNSTATDVSPFGTISASRTFIQQALYAPLFYIKGGEFLDSVKPYIGKTITKTDDYTYDIEIFDNIVDSKGNPIKADDVIWSYEKSAELYNFSPYLTNVESLTASDDTHLTMKLNTKVPGTIETLVCDSRLSIVSKDWYEGASDDEIMNDPATSGPYTVKSVISGSEVVMTARKDYWKTNKDDMNPSEYRNVNDIVLKVITEEAMRSISMETGEIDYASIGVTNLHRFYDNGKATDGYNVWIGSTTPTFACVYMNMDEKSDSLFAKNENLRKAALYAIDSEALMIAKGYNSDTGRVLKGFGNTKTGGYQESWNNEDYFDYNPEKAREFLKEAGYEPGEVEITVMTTMMQPDTIRSVLIANLEDAGFKVNNFAVEQALYMKYAKESDQWDMCYGTKGFYNHVVPVWDANFNPAGYTNGSVCFTHDDTLTDLLFAAEEDPSVENLNAFNNYLKDHAIIKALFEGDGIEVCQDGILKMEIGMFGFDPSASVYASDYVSSPGAAN